MSLESRNIAIYRRHQRGESYTQIAHSLGLSPYRIQQICSSMRWRYIRVVRDMMNKDRMSNQTYRIQYLASLYRLQPSANFHLRACFEKLFELCKS